MIRKGKGPAATKLAQQLNAANAGVAARQQASPTGPLRECIGMFCKRVPAFWDNQRRHETLLQQTRTLHQAPWIKSPSQLGVPGAMAYNGTTPANTAHLRRSAERGTD